jgi:hypothetical protein
MNSMQPHLASRLALVPSTLKHGGAVLTPAVLSVPPILMPSDSPRSASDISSLICAQVCLPFPLLAASVVCIQYGQRELSTWMGVPHFYKAKSGMGFSRPISKEHSREQKGSQYPGPGRDSSRHAGVRRSSHHRNHREWDRDRARKHARNPLKVGQQLKVGDTWVITVNAVKTASQGINEFDTPKAGNR